MVLSGKRPGIGQQSQHGNRVHTERPARCRDAVAFNECGKNRCATLDVHSVHANYCSINYPTANRKSR